MSASRAYYSDVALTALIGACLACAPRAPVSQPAAATPAPSSDQRVTVFSALTSEAVVVLPLYGAFDTDDTTGLSGATIDELLRIFEANLGDSLRRHVGARWIMPPALRALHRRNPLNVPDPARVALEPALERRRVPLTLEQGPASDVRALVAVSGARRYALVPFWLGVQRTQPGGVQLVLPGSSGGYWGKVGIALIDSRLAEIAAVRTVASGPHPTRLAAASGAAVALSRLFASGER
jgi:hypothetical protein